MKTLERATLPERSELSPARRRLFETALALFSRDGYNGVSVRDIVGELGQQPTAIYAHVNSKQELLYELVKMGHEELRDRIRTAVLDASGDPLDQLRAIAHANAMTHLTVPELARVCHNEYTNLSPQQCAVIDVLRADLGSLLRDVVARGITSGAFAPAEPAVAMYAVTAMGTRVTDWWTPGHPLDRDTVATAQADLAVRMLTR